MTLAEFGEHEQKLIAYFDKFVSAKCADELQDKARVAEALEKSLEQTKENMSVVRWPSLSSSLYCRCFSFIFWGGSGNSCAFFAQNNSVFWNEINV